MTACEEMHRSNQLQDRMMVETIGILCKHEGQTLTLRYEKGNI